MGDGILRLDFDGGWSVKQLSDFLSTFRRAYGSVLHFEHSIESREEFHPPRHWRGDYPPFLLLDPAVWRPEQVEDPDGWTTSLALVGEPQLKTIHIASPGVIEAIGKLNPFAVISDFIKWFKNRDLEREKLVNEVEHGSLENEILKNKVVKERIDILRELGVPKRKIRELIANQIAKPLQDLGPFIDGKNVKAEIKVLPGKAEVINVSPPEPETEEEAEVEMEEEDNDSDPEDSAKPR